MSHPRCPITQSSNVEVVEEIDTRKIINLYKDILSLGAIAPFDTLKYILKYRSPETGYYFFYPFSLQSNEALYQNLEKQDWYYMKEKWEYDESIKILNEKQKVLEIGCGDGAFLEKLVKTFSNNPIGLEMNQAAIEKARKKGLNISDALIGDFANQNGQTFDVICMFQVLEHIAEVGVFLKSVMKLLKPGGKLIVCVPNNNSFIKKDDSNPLNLPPHHMGLWNDLSLESLSKHFELKVDTILYEPLQMHHVEWYTRIQLKYYFGVKILDILNRLHITRYLSKYYKKRRDKIKGHSILAIYTKL